MRESFAGAQRESSRNRDLKRVLPIGTHLLECRAPTSYAFLNVSSQIPILCPTSFSSMDSRTCKTDLIYEALIKAISDEPGQLVTLATLLMLRLLQPSVVRQPPDGTKT